MSKLKEVKDNVVSTFLSKQEGSTTNIDPATIILIVELTVELIKIIQDCQTKGYRVDTNSPTLLQKRFVKMKVFSLLGFWANIKHGSKMVSALLEVGKTLTEEDFKQMVEEM